MAKFLLVTPWGEKTRARKRKREKKRWGNEEMDGCGK
jgi:hypothetical protein